MLEMGGVDVNPVVSTVRVCPYSAVPVMVTVPLNWAGSVANESVGLAGDA